MDKNYLALLDTLCDLGIVSHSGIIYRHPNAGPELGTSFIGVTGRARGTEQEYSEHGENIRSLIT